VTDLIVARLEAHTVLNLNRPDVLLRTKAKALRRARFDATSPTLHLEAGRTCKQRATERTLSFQSLQSVGRKTGVSRT
jgi:hypothetical protein